ncbi:transglutaminaseTgpA domain-containing protein [Cryptosporangium japonicum]|uniref:Transglutaminase-like domain-containing protein n=1 Tax=Cryptosporangium japonicum TaxID=80872 RepID=A0ABN0V6G4_9ACTN
MRAFRSGVDLVLAAGTAAAAGLVFTRAFAAGLPAVVVAAAAVGVLTTALAAGWWRWPPVASLVFSAVVAVLVAAVRLGGPGPVGDGLLNGWARLLTTTLPVPPRPDLLLVPAAVTWLAAAAGAELVVRRAGPVLAIAPAGVAYVVAVGFCVPADGSLLLPTAVLVAGAGALLLTRGAGTVAARASGVAVLAVAVVVAGTVVVALPSDGAVFDPRAAYRPPVRAVPADDPLERAGAFLAEPDRVLFRVEADAPARWRLVTLPLYDGVRWRTAARFDAAGLAVPPARTSSGRPSSGLPSSGLPSGRLSSGRTGPVIHQRITVRALPGALVPAADRPAALPSATGLLVDADSGALLSTRPLRPGRTFTLTSAPPAARTAEALLALRAARPEPDEVAVPAEPPAGLRRLADVAGPATDPPYLRAYRIERELRRSYANDPRVPPGQTLGHLRTFLDGTRRGSTVQFAVAFALAARLAGLPTRLVVGFAPSSVWPASGVQDVRGRDVLVWAQVRFDGAGWLSFLPTPGESRGSGSGSVPVPGEDTATAAAARAAEQRYTAAPRGPAVDAAVRTGPEPVTSSSWGGAFRAGGTALLVLVLGYLVLVTAVPVRRRHRGRRAGPQAQVVAAWAAVLDELAWLGWRPSPSAGATEVARDAEPRVGPAGVVALRELARAANRARYGGTAPQTHQVRGAWLRSAAVRRAARRHAGLRRRLIAAVHPRRALPRHRFRDTAVGTRGRGRTSATRPG